MCYWFSNIAVVGSDNDCELRNVLREVSAKHVLVIGDFNYANIDWQVGVACQPLTQKF